MSSPIKDHLHFSPFTVALVRQGMVGQSVKKVKRAKLANRKSQGGGGGVLPSKRLLNGDVPLDGVAFSQLD